MKRPPDTKLLLTTVHTLIVSANTVAYCYSKNPKNFASALQQLQDGAEEAALLLRYIEGTDL